MPVPHELQARLIAETGQSGETVVAFALLPRGQSPNGEA